MLPTSLPEPAILYAGKPKIMYGDRCMALSSDPVRNAGAQYLNC